MPYFLFILIENYEIYYKLMSKNRNIKDQQNYLKYHEIIKNIINKFSYFLQIDKW